MIIYNYWLNFKRKITDLIVNCTPNAAKLIPVKVLDSTFQNIIYVRHLVRSFLIIFADTVDGFMIF